MSSCSSHFTQTCVPSHAWNDSTGSGRPRATYVT
jgi:hypothetical protein